MIRIALFLALLSACPSLARADVLPISAGARMRRSIEIETDDTAHVLVLYPVDWGSGAPGSDRRVAEPGAAIDNGRGWASPRVWALTREELATLPEYAGPELDAWMAAFEGPRSDEIATDVEGLSVAGVTDVYSAHVDGSQVVLHLVRSEYEHHTGSVEVVDARPDGTRGLPGWSAIDELRVAFGVVPFCCYPVPCCGVLLLAPFAWRAYRRRRDAKSPKV